MKSTVIVALLLVAVAAGAADGARVLAVFGVKVKSHMMVHEPLLVALAERGHDVHVYGHYATPGHANLTFHKLERAGTLQPGLEVNVLERAWTRIMNPITLLRKGADDCEALFTDHGVRALLQSNQRFDLLITELFNTECYLGIAHRFQVPVVAVSTSPIMPWGNARFGNPDSPAYVPNMYSGFSDEMDLWERAFNALHILYMRAAKSLVYDGRDQRLLDRVLGPGVPPVRELARNTSLLLVNTYHALSLPRPFVPNVIEVGGIHIKAQKPLPQDLEQFVSGAKDGVIVFSLGSMIRTSSLPKEHGAALLKALGTLKQRVLWKWEDEAPGPVPKNVRLLKWMPQFDTICHNNTRLFIGHGGLLSTSEAAHCGVPLLGIAMYGDQRLNLAAIAKAGAGRSVPYATLKNADLFIKNVRDMLEDPSYRENAKVLSARYRDRPMSPLETAVYWTEYVIRHKGAPHLRGAARNLAWWQEALLDVMAVVALGLAAALYVLWVALRALARIALSMAAAKKDPKKKKA